MTQEPGNHPSVAPLPAWKLVSATFVGGVAGSLARGSLELAFVTVELPAWGSRIAVNVVGAFLIGCLFARIASRDGTGAPIGIPHTHRLHEHLLGAGCLGGFTTVSGMAWDVTQALAADQLSSALLLLSANALAGMAACACGFVLGSRAPRSFGR